MTDGMTRLADVLTSDVEIADQVVTRILDAARAQFARFGVRRSSIDDIAKRAGLSRNTVFRRLGSKDELVAAVMLRELRGLIAEVDRVAAQADGVAERLANAFATTVTGIRANPLFLGVISNRPDEVHDLAIVQAGHLMQVAVRHVADLFKADQERGAIPVGLNVVGAAEVIVRTLHSTVLIPHIAARLHTEEELRAFAAEQLAPLLTATVPAPGERPAPELMVESQHAPD